MSDRLLKTAVETKIHVNSWWNTRIDRMYRGDRSRGQTAAEYIGMIIVVVAIMAVVAQGTDLGDAIKDKIKKAIDKIIK